MYKKKATALAEAIKAEVEDIHIEYNPSAPRRGSFEVTLIVEDGETQGKVYAKAPDIIKLSHNEKFIPSTL